MVYMKFYNITKLFLATILLYTDLCCCIQISIYKEKHLVLFMFTSMFISVILLLKIKKGLCLYGKDTL